MDAASGSRPAGRSAGARLLAMVGLLVVFGCSAGGPREAGLSSLAVEPELPAGVAARLGPRTGVARVPQVIPTPRPFRMAELGSMRPARSKSVATAWEEGPGAGYGSVQTVAAVEPIHREPAILAPTESVVGAEPAVAEIRDMLNGYLRAFNQHDAAAVADHWAADGESLNLDSGERTAGREAIRAVFAELFAAEAATRLAIDVQEIRPVRADVAVVDGLARIEAANGTAVGTRFSTVVIRDDDRWLVQSMREAAAEASARRPHPLSDLAWLVGFWEDEGEGVTAGTRCEWTPGQQFLLRSHTVATESQPASLPQAGDQRIPRLLAPGPATPVELTEVIGWDPDRESIRSWIFATDGRFAEATWQPDAAGWVVLVEGRGADTGRVARCTLLTEGPDEYVVECDGDGEALAGLIPPACGFTRTAR